MMNYLIYLLVAVGLALAVIRLFKGPTSFDRVLSLDTLNIMITSGIVLLALYENNAFYLDIALVYGMLSFLETIVFARYLEGKR